MDKLLTVSIASYNVEKKKKKTLDSCIIPEILDDLEIIIEDDGSTDGTAALAQKYVDKFPNTFRLIRKQNGGYGSTVNRSIKEATGKYFKLLDGDDWFDHDGLIELIDQLKTTDSDLYLNRYYSVIDGTWESALCESTWDSYEGGTFSIDQIKCELPIGIWNTTVRTEAIRKSTYQLPEHMFYTDQLFVIRFMPFIKTITFSKTPVYCYRIGRDGQTVSKESRIKNYKNFLFVFREGLNLYKNTVAISPDNRHMMCSRNSTYFYRALCSILLMGPSKERYKEMLELKNHCRNLAPDVYQHAVKISKKVKMLHYTAFLAYWFLAGKQENW